MTLSIAQAALITLATLAAMEGLAWWLHKYVMHGFGWGWHRSHHEPRHGTFETNDLYAVVFAGLSIALFLTGTFVWAPAFWIGLGMTGYGFIYFLFHDGLVHRRVAWFDTPRGGYLKRIYQAHRIHHAVSGKHGCVSFGFLYAPPVERLKRDLQARTGA